MNSATSTAPPLFPATTCHKQTNACYKPALSKLLKVKTAQGDVMANFMLSMVALMAFTAAVSGTLRCRIAFYV